MRQPWAIRLTHWLNVVLLALMIGSGLQIFNAHPALYAADASRSDRTVFMLPTRVTDRVGVAHSEMILLGWHINTGRFELPAIPRTVTVGGWLAGGRRWHLSLMWPFMANGLLYAIYLFASGEARRRLMRRQDWPGIPAVFRHYLARGPLPPTDGYNPLQRLTYSVLVFFAAPLVVLTGLAMSPQFNAHFPWYADLFGGRQFARTWHFVVMAGFVGFTVMHVLLVASAGWPTFWSMVAGGPSRRKEPAVD